MRCHARHIQKEEYTYLPTFDKNFVRGMSRPDPPTPESGKSAIIGFTRYFPDAPSPKDFKWNFWSSIIFKNIIELLKFDFNSYYSQRICVN